MLTIDWQPLVSRLGYDVPEVVAEAGLEGRYVASLERSRELAEALAPTFPAESVYAVALAYRIRYSMQMNAREAMHLLELRSGTAGTSELPLGGPGDAPPDRRAWPATGCWPKPCATSTHSAEELGRLDAERRAEQRRNSLSGAGNPANA